MVDILYSSDGSIKAATLERLVRALTDKSSTPAFRHSFLLSYRSFTTPIVLLQTLAQRFWQAEGDESENNLMRTRVVGVLKAWLEGHFYDFLGDQELTAQFLKLVERLTKQWPSAGEQLNKVLGEGFAWLMALRNFGFSFRFLFIEFSLRRLFVGVW